MTPEPRNWDVAERDHYIESLLAELQQVRQNEADALTELDFTRTENERYREAIEHYLASVDAPQGEHPFDGAFKELRAALAPTTQEDRHA